MAKKKNKNITPLKYSDLENEINYNDFGYKKYFEHLCNLTPEVEKERLSIKEIGNKDFKRKGLVYVFVIDDYIFKIGQTITSITKRVQSYNCGKMEY